MAISDEGMDLASQQIDASQQTERAMALVFMIPGEGRMDTGLGRQVGSRRGDGLDAGFSSQETIATDFALFGLPFFDLVRAFFSTATIVAHLVRLDFLIAEDLADGALDQSGQA